ncbi:MAG: thymidylate synthase, partial [Candidatus Levybacteria bacterium]|nr:thymidylate synthase [Candidatus Levybacteria bacterium]
YLVDRNVHIWDEWAYKGYKVAQISNIKYQISNKKRKIGNWKLEIGNSEQKGKEILTQDEFIEKLKKLPPNHPFVRRWGDLGNVYGVQWRRWRTSDGRTIDQLSWAIEKLKKTPTRKHIIISAWNPEFIYEMALPGKSMALPPCHTLFQLDVRNKKLSLHLYMRSADFFLGVPFNIASYSLLTMMLARVTGLKAGEFILTFGDVHLYSNHFKQVREQLKRKPRTFPKMKINPKVKSIDDFKIEDFELVGYNPYDPIKAEVTVVGGF